MPELPEVETVRRSLHESTCDRQIISSEILLERTIAYPHNPEEFNLGLKGKRILSWHRRGKYLLAELSNDSWLGVHLRMTGKLLWCDRSLPIHTHTRIRIYFANQQELRFNDQRTFGQMWLVPSGINPEEIISGVQKLGMEPFDPNFNYEYLQNKLRKSDRPIKNSLLDQTVIAGIGNIYADESLFLSGIHPQTKSNQLTKSQLESLVQAIRRVLSDGITHGGTTFSDFVDIGGDKGNYIHSAWVFRRTGQPCKVCSGVIARIKLGGRSTHFCPKCQPIS
ncbi:formamidopyrimidine-DNA glycosylase Fpg [Synechococcus sp. PCC 7502]|uniref:DNA-formamidopyrimidine glycosylase n=1 Tax=Synechococcus sp. PCC 7502 TaxID=1173263 RepID=UPI00029FF6FA|nr:DNA-formamidopyrimidine glycosylase [Synechococcus sp. PCC 7502]AFY72246.1 formamidopyrimidine-DNA glycosylase Fpg [Synechococcus sp. PCC 7502]